MTHKSARTIAKIAAGLLLGALAGLAISLDPADSDGIWINVMGGVIGLGLMILIYEGVWRLIAWPMCRRVPAGRDVPPIAIAYGVVGHPLANLAQRPDGAL